jgi:hypothetical protein
MDSVGRIAAQARSPVVTWDSGRRETACDGIGTSGDLLLVGAMSPCYQLVAISDDKCTFGRATGRPPQNPRLYTCGSRWAKEVGPLSGRRFGRGWNPVTREKERT